SLFRTQLAGVATPAELAARLPALRDELSHQADLALRISGKDGTPWFDSRTQLPDTTPPSGLATLHTDGTDYRSLAMPLKPADPQSAQL
ncbi:hypothetical protein SB912_29100, partial [Pantoea sp. SIMBA_072]